MWLELVHAPAPTPWQEQKKSYTPPMTPPSAWCESSMVLSEARGGVAGDGSGKRGGNTASSSPQVLPSAAAASSVSRGMTGADLFASKFALAVTTASARPPAFTSGLPAATSSSAMPQAEALLVAGRRGDWG